LNVSYPEKLQDLLDAFAAFDDQSERAQMLIGYSDAFREVPPDVATRPFPASHLVPQCESEAYAWAVLQRDGGLKLHFAVENPSGISARALAAILDKTLSGLPPEQIAQIQPDLVERIFRQNISMGKGLGLMSMVLAVRALAERAMGRTPRPLPTTDKPFSPE
jgi:cysteine desulfuration protein SufE